jgi:Conserved protein/domain typically associated with flavoprotein oxygenases, DIM6/NTAB family
MSETDVLKSIGSQNFILPCPIVLVGSYHESPGGDKIPNIMTAAWSCPCSAQPPALAVAVRGSRQTHKDILKHKAFTLSIPDTKILPEVDYCGIFSVTQENKFERTKLTPVTAEHVDAPYVQECPVVIELTLIKTCDVGTHTLFIGEIMDVKIRESALNAEGLPDPEKLDVLAYVPMLREYRGLGEFKAKAFGIGKTIVASNVSN